MTEPSPMAARLHDSIRANRDIRIPLNHTMAAYMAPELCNALDSPSTNLAEYGSYIDQYSFGCAHVR